MWTEKLWKKKNEKFYPHTLLKTFEFLTLGCGEKNVDTLRQILVFHIIFPYHYHYYLNLRKIYISIIV